MQNEKQEVNLRHRVLTIIGIVLCVILVPVLIINCTLLIKGWTDRDSVPSFGGLTIMIVTTPSMQGEAADSFNAGDLIFIKMAKPEEVKENQVITFFDPDGNGKSVLTHRVVEIFEKDGRTYYRTRGDANDADDPSPAPAKNLIGIYTGFRLPGGGSIAMFMQSTTGLIICVFVPLVALIAYDMIRRRRYEKRHETDKDALIRELEELRRLKEQQLALLSEDTPIEDTPIEDTPVEDAPVEDAPDEDTPVEQAPAEDAPVEDAPTEQAPVEDTPAEDTPIEDAPAEDAPVEDAPTEDAPAEQAPASETSDSESPVLAADA